MANELQPFNLDDPSELERVWSALVDEFNQARAWDTSMADQVLYDSLVRLELLFKVLRVFLRVRMRRQQSLEKAKLRAKR